MSWNKILAWLPGKKNQTPARSHQLDHQLVKNTQSTRWPRWSQLKYLFHFLNQTEKRILWSCFAVFLIAGSSLLFLFTSSHLTRLPKEGGEYQEALIGQPKAINPLFAPLNDVDTDLTALIYAGLFRYSEQQKLEPYLAKDYSVSADKKTYTVTLTDNAFFSDGKPVTIDDVVFTFELIQNPEVGSPLLPAFQGVKIEKVNASTIRFTLKEPFAPFINSLTVGIIPIHIWGEIQPNSLKLARQNLEPIGAGPWRYSKLLKDQSGRIESFFLVQNDHYFKNKPFIKTLHFTFYNEYREAVDAMRTQSTMGLAFVPHSLEDKLNSRTLRTIPLKLPQYTTLFFNLLNEPLLKDDNVRLALSSAIDKVRLVNEALQGYGEPVDSPILEGSIGYYPDLKKIETDTVKANELLDKAWTRVEPETYFKLEFDATLKASQADVDAFKQANSSTPEKIPEFEEQLKTDITNSIRKGMDAEQQFYRKDKTDKILELTITTVDTPEYSKTAELISKMWQEIGVKTNIQKISSQQIIRELLKKRNYQTLLYGEIIGFDPDPFPFWHSSQSESPGLNLSGYSNRTADALLEEARTTIDESKRNELYRKFQEQLVKDIPAVFLNSPIYTYALSNTVQGVNLKTVNAPADRFVGLPEWYIKTKLRWKKS